MNNVSIETTNEAFTKRGESKMTRIVIFTSTNGQTKETIIFCFVFLGASTEKN